MTLHASLSLFSYSDPSRNSTFFFLFFLLLLCVFWPSTNVNVVSSYWGWRVAAHQISWQNPPTSISKMLTNHNPAGLIWHFASLQESVRLKKLDSHMNLCVLKVTEKRSLCHLVGNTTNYSCWYLTVFRCWPLCWWVFVFYRLKSIDKKKIPEINDWLLVIKDAGVLPYFYRFTNVLYLNMFKTGDVSRV